MTVTESLCLQVSPAAGSSSCEMKAAVDLLIHLFASGPAARRRAPEWWASRITAEAPVMNRYGRVAATNR